MSGSFFGQPTDQPFSSTIILLFANSINEYPSKVLDLAGTDVPIFPYQLFLSTAALQIASQGASVKSSTVYTRVVDFGDIEFQRKFNVQKIKLRKFYREMRDVAKKFGKLHR